MPDTPRGSAAGWTRWSIEKSHVPGSGDWHVRHDCGYFVIVDLLANPNAIVEAERAHERTCR